ESLLIVNGDRWWQRDHQGHVETDEVIQDRTQRRRQPQLTDFERHFSHASLREFFVALTLESLGEARVAERDCIGIRAIPRPGGRLWPHWLPSGADEYEFWAD